MKSRYVYTGFILAAGLGAWLLLRPASGTADAPAPSAMVSAVQAVQRHVPRQIQASGSIIAGAAEQSLTLNAAGILSFYDVAQGEQVAPGQALAQLAPDPAEAANLQKARNAVTAAQAAHNHIAALLPAHLATAADLAAATQTLQDARTALAALRASGAGATFILRAPEAGLVTALSAAPGGSLAAGTILLKLAPSAGLLAGVGLEQSQAAQVQPGAAATLTLLNTGGTMPARVVSVGSALDPQTGLIDLTLRPAAPVPLGEPLAVTINAGQLSGYVVPNDAVLRDDQGSYVYQLDQKDIAHRQNVTVLQQGAAETVLAPGLNPNWRIATIGAYQLADGMHAAVQGAGS